MVRNASCYIGPSFAGESRRLLHGVACEYTSATTTQCVEAMRRSWATSLLERMNLPVRLFGSLVEAGTPLGPLRLPDARADAVTLVAPACHDTGSAVAAKILEHWDRELRNFRKVMPVDYKRALTELKAEAEAEAAGEEAPVEASAT